MKKMMWIISFAALAGTAIVLQFMPDRVPMHYDMAGNIDRWGSKSENLIFPIIILAMSLFWTLFIRFYEKKAVNVSDEKEGAAARSNAKVLGIVGVSMAAMFTIMQGFILYGAYKEGESGATAATIDHGRISCILLGILFIVLGNFMTKTRINGLVGVRISWSMYNDNTWRKSNRFGAIAIMSAGLLTIVTAIWMKNSFGATMMALGYIGIVTIMTVMYAHKVYKTEIEQGRNKY